MRYFIQISFVVLVLGLISCHKPPEYPSSPSIAFERLKLTDTSTLVLTFEFIDGDGDIGLDNENINPNDVFEPYHQLSVIFDNSGDLVTINGDHDPPFSAIPAALLPIDISLFRGTSDQGQPLFENINILALFATGDQFDLENEFDTRPAGYDCNDYEIISFYDVDTTFNNQGEIVSEVLVEIIDTVHVQRNPFHYNIYIDLLVKQGDETFEPLVFPNCDPGFTARFPVFDRSAFGGPLDGSISYAFFSTQFATDNSFLLNETLKLRFFIYDRELNKSEPVETPEFRLLDLRQGDLTAE